MKTTITFELTRGRYLCQRKQRICNRRMNFSMCIIVWAMPRSGYFQLGARAREHAQLLLPGRGGCELVDGADAVVLEDEGDALGAESLGSWENRGQWTGRSGAAPVPAAQLPRETSSAKAQARPLPMPGVAGCLPRWFLVEAGAGSVLDHAFAWFLQGNEKSDVRSVALRVQPSENARRRL